MEQVDMETFMKEHYESDIDNYQFVQDCKREERERIFNKIKEEFNHFCKCINFGTSFLDARAIRFLNEFDSYFEGEK